jgi:hypothetical protein
METQQLFSLEDLNFDAPVSLAVSRNNKSYGLLKTAKHLAAFSAIQIAKMNITDKSKLRATTTKSGKFLAITVLNKEYEGRFDDSSFVLGKNSMLPSAVGANLVGKANTTDAYVKLNISDAIALAEGNTYVITFEKFSAAELAQRIEASKVAGAKRAGNTGKPIVLKPAVSNSPAGVMTKK